jgi:hypothetical protein
MREEKGGSKAKHFLVVQQPCKAKHFFLVARTRKPSDFKNCEIYFTFSFHLYDKYFCSPMLIFPMIVYFNC